MREEAERESEISRIFEVNSKRKDCTRSVVSTDTCGQLKLIKQFRESCNLMKTKKYI